MLISVLVKCQISTLTEGRFLTKVNWIDCEALAAWRSFQLISHVVIVSWRLMHIYRHDSSGGVIDFSEFSGVSWDIFCLNRRSPDSHLCDSGLCTLRISEGKSKGVQESGLHHKNNKFYCYSQFVASAFSPCFFNDLSSSCSLASSSSEVVEMFCWLLPCRNLLLYNLSYVNQLL